MFNINPYNKLLEQNLLMALFRKKITNIYSKRIMNQSLAYWLRNHKVKPQTFSYQTIAVFLFLICTTFAQLVLPMYVRDS